MRQAGIFARQSPKSLENLWIFLHVGTDTPMQRELKIFSSKSHKNLFVDTTWFTLHQAVLKSCLNDWRSYINYLGKEVDRHVSFQSTQFMAFLILNSSLIRH